MKEDAKKFLRKIRIERSEIRILERKINETRLELLPGAIRYDLDKVQADPKDRMFEAIEELAEYNIQLKKMIKKLYRDQAQAASHIAKIPESEQRQVLELYYLSQRNPTWDSVASEMNYSRRKVLNLHGDALLWLNKHAAFKEK